MSTDVTAKRTIRNQAGARLGVDAYRPAAEFIARYRRIWMSLHVSPDGDSLGSNFGLAHMLRLAGHDVTVFSSDQLGDSFAPLLAADPGARVVIGAPPPAPPPDAWVILDSSDPRRLGVVYSSQQVPFAGRPVLNIDHHPTNQEFGDLNIVDASAAAVGEQVPLLLEAMGLAPDARAANWLLLGTVTDTLGFRTSSTSARTMATAATLMEHGGDLYGIMDEMFGTRPLSQILLWGRALANVQTDGRTLWTTVTREMLRETGAQDEDAEGLASFLAGVRSMKVFALLKEREDGTRVSLRSNPGVDVSAIATLFNGGGHKQAAGCTIPAFGPAAAEKLLAAVAQVLGPRE
ncbi:MAG: bifunctional oligoribonuclease/PAP phosphatase NrnA [Candidatus Dormibacteraeota bacterium]|nr:bifunctional oligoribonuclease/PAP phosphatase NrnA [Candidatus Dormibacteraeota bacterium]